MTQVKVLSKKVVIEKDGKKKVFYRYFTPVRIHVIKDGEDLGEQEKSLEVHFTKDASKQLVKFTDEESIFAIIGGNIGLPYVYEVKENEDGSINLPQCWIRSVESYKEIPFTPKKSTCQPILEEESDTEPVELTEDTPF